MMKLFVRQWLVLILGLFALSVQAADVNIIDVAGQQRMLSQRIVKAWCQVGLKVEPELSQIELQEAVLQFESNLDQLKPTLNSSRAKTAYAGLKAAWDPLRRGAEGTVQQAGAEQLNARAEDVLMAAERLVNALQAQTQVPVGRWVNLAGHQRMLSQRLVKSYMLLQWGVEDAALRDEMERVQSEFSGALERMQQHATQPVLRAELENLALQWEWMQTVLATEGAESFRLIMAEGGEAVLQLADNVVKLYGKSAE
jgi:PilJ/NarX-like methyl-accepting chemotaxis transducer